jgi:hypothetical protein
MFLRIAVLAVVVTAMCAGRTAAAASLCPQAPAQPVVNLKITEEPIDFEANRTRAELTAMEAAAHSHEVAAGRKTYHSFVGGLMQGEMSLFHDIEFGVATSKKTGQSCLWITQVNVRLVLAPLIYVGQDLQQQDYWHREIYRHELKHVDADRALLQKYAARMADGLGMALATPADYMSANFPRADLPEQRQYMHAMVAQPLGVLFAAMLHERDDVHADVDTAGEYARVAGICGGMRLPRVAQAQGY